jgi:hypothetical protein
MAFPFTRRASVTIAAPIDAAKAAGRIATALERARASRVRVRGTRVVFRVKFFRFVSNWNILVPLDQGRFRVTGHAGALVVHYELSFRRMLGIATLLVCGFLAPMLMFSGPPSARPVQFALVVLAWCWLFGGNYVIACARFPGFIRRAVTKPGD